MFDLRKVKPAHGWREFLGEVGIIVLGVLIALSAEQVAERIHWAHQVEGARSALRSDYEAALVDAREREAEDGCIRRRLGQLAAALDRPDGQLPARGSIGAPAARTWQSASWASTISAQIAPHFPRDEMLQFGDIQAQGVVAEQTSAREMDDWAVLSTLVGPSRRLEGGEAPPIRRALADAAYRANLMRLVSYQLEYSILQTGLLTPDDRRQADADLRHVLSGPNRRALCAATAVPAADGHVEAPYDPQIERDPVDPRQRTVNLPDGAAGR